MSLAVGAAGGSSETWGDAGCIEGCTSTIEDRTGVLIDENIGNPLLCATICDWLVVSGSGSLNTGAEVTASGVGSGKIEIPSRVAGMDFDVVEIAFDGAEMACDGGETSFDGLEIASMGAKMPSDCPAEAVFIV